MKRYISILVLCVGILTSADAQTFTQRIQQKTGGQGTITIHQSDSIDQLVNTTVLSNRPVKPVQNTTGGQGGQNAQNVPNSQSVQNGQTELQGGEEGAQQPRATYRTMGYRVQAFAGGNSRADRQQAERTRNLVKSHYPNVPVYVHFYSPRWICRVGNYRTYEEAHQMMTSLQSLGLSQCTIVKGKISVVY